MISSFAKKLPVFMHNDQTIMQRVTGAYLISKGSKKLKSGEKVEPDKFYAMEVKKAVNHRKQMEKVFEKDGVPGVYAYCEAIVKKSNEVPPVQASK